MKDNAPSFLASYLAPLRTWLDAPDVVEIALNADGRVWVERHGGAHMQPCHEVTFDKSQSQHLANSIAGHIGSQFSEKRPVLSGKILDQGKPLRAQVIAPPVVDGGVAITLRRYSHRRIALEEILLLHGKLVDLDKAKRQRAALVSQLSSEGRILEAMQLCIEDRLNVVISGGTSTGKTTFARGLLELVSAEERIVTIEDAFELFPSQPNAVSLRAERVGDGERTAAKLLEASLRMRPDRIILGELRGEEAKTFLEAINTGHGGSFTTIHADTAIKAIDRLALMVMATGLNMGFEEVRRYCANSIDVVIQLGRAEGRRGVAEIYLPAASAAS